MNAFNDVNLAAACIVTSTECAQRMGIKPEKWIYPLGGGRGKDSEDCTSSPKQSSLDFTNQATLLQFGTVPTSTLAVPLPLP